MRPAKIEVGADQVLDLDPFPFAPNEQVLIRRKRPNALGEAPEIIFGLSATVW